MVNIKHNDETKIRGTVITLKGDYQKTTQKLKTLKTEEPQQTVLPKETDCSDDIFLYEVY